MRALLLVLAATFTASTAALAGSATQEEADRIAKVLQSYSGDAPGFASAVPDGDAYTIKLDFSVMLNKLLAASEAKLAIASAATTEFHARPLGSGQWQVTQNSPFNWKVDGGADLAFDMKADSLAFDGVFDENLRAFVSQTAEAKNLTFSQHLAEAGKQTSDVTYTLASMQYTGTGKDAGAGAVDSTAKFTFGEMTEVMHMKPDQGMPVDINLAVSSGEQTTDYTGFKAGALFDLVRWTFNNLPEGDDSLDEAKLGELKDSIAAVLPVFQKISGTGSFSELKADTLIGQFNLAKGGYKVELNGVIPEGLLSESITLEQLTVPAGLAPEWSNDLIPQRLHFDFRLTGYDLAKPAELLLANFSEFVVPFSKGDLEAQMMKALLPTGAVTFGLTALEAKAPAYDVSLAGTVTGGENVKPEGNGTLRAKSLLPLIETLKKAPETLGFGQAIPMVIMINSIARKEADGSLRWDIEGTKDGKFLVNGVDYAALANLGGGIPDQQ